MNIELIEQWIETKRAQIGIIKRDSPRYEYEMGQKHLLNELSKFLDDNSAVEEFEGVRAYNSVFIDHLAEAIANRINARFQTEMSDKKLPQDSLNEITGNKKIGTLLSSREVIQRLGISHTTLWRLIKKEQIPAPRKVGRLNRWQESDIENYISISHPTLHQPNETEN